MLTFEGKLIQRLKDHLAESADAALTTPVSRDLYEYGRVVGYHQGLKETLKMIEELMAEADEENQRDGRILSLHR